MLQQRSMLKCAINLGGWLQNIHAHRTRGLVVLIGGLVSSSGGMPCNVKGKSST